MAKRARTASGYTSGGGGGNARSRARAASARISKKFPLRDYGRIHVKRGTADNIGRYGSSWKGASEPQREHRRTDGYYGRGDYRRWARYIPRGLGAMGGYATGGIRGARAGWNAGGAVSKAFGWGDYGMQTNQIVGTQRDQMQIAVNPSNNSGDIIFDHTEFIGNVIVPGHGGTGEAASAVQPSKFHIDHFPLNPGQEAVFPFLSQLAKQFEMFEFAGLMFQYKPLSGEGASSTNALGKVIMSTNYDPAALLFTNSHAMENYEYSSSTKPSSGQIHGVETEPSQRLTKQLFVNNVLSAPGPAPVGQKDKMLTDLGVFQLGTEGIPVTAQPTIIGELWVSYKVKLTRAALTDILEHRDLEVQAIECIFTSDSTHPSLPRALSTFESSTLRLETHLTPTTLVVTFPTQLQTGVYRVHVILSGQTTDSSTGSPVVFPDMSANNLAVVNGQGLSDPQYLWMLAQNSQIHPPSMASAGDKGIWSTDGLTPHHPMAVGYVRLDHLNKDPTQPGTITFSTAAMNNLTRAHNTRMRVIISECNEVEVMSVMNKDGEAEFKPWQEPDPLFQVM